MTRTHLRKLFSKTNVSQLSLVMTAAFLRHFFAPEKSHSPTVTFADPASWLDVRSFRSRYAAGRAPSARPASHLNRCAQTDATGVGSRERALYQADDGITKRRTCCHWPSSSRRAATNSRTHRRSYETPACHGKTAMDGKWALARRTTCRSGAASRLGRSNRPASRPSASTGRTAISQRINRFLACFRTPHVR